MRLRAAIAATLRPLAAPILFVMIVAAVDAVGMRLAELTVTGFGPILQAASLFLALGLAWTVAGELKIGGSRAILLTQLGRGTSFFAVGGFAATGGVIFSYLCARPAWPLIDSALIAIDRAMGFSWPAWMAMLSRWPGAKAVLDEAYASYVAQSALLYLLACFLRDHRRPAELFFTVNLGALACSATSAMLPALGAKVVFDHHASWLADLLALRRSGPMAIDFADMKGIVSLPSFHAGLGVFFAWAARGTGWFGWAVAAVNGIMIVSALSTGGHYLIDIVTGVTLAIAVIALVHRVLYRSAGGDAPERAAPPPISYYRPGDHPL